ncbi:unnamed protein product, partial [Owenia fusiformis]
PFSVRQSTMFLIASLWVDIFLIFLAVWVLSGSKVFAIILSIVVWGALEYFKLPLLEKRISDIVLNTDESGRLPIIAHRGGQTDAPENTIASFREARRNGAQAVELDLAFTKDGIAVLLHDFTVDRTTDGTGYIDELMYEDVKKLDASSKHELKDHFPNEGIPTLEEGLVECLGLGLKVYIDVKGDAQKAAVAITDVYQKHPSLYTMAIVCSFNPLVIYAVRRADPDIITGMTHRPGIVGYWYQEGNYVMREFVCPILDIVLEWSQYHWLWYVMGNSAFLARDDQISKRFVNFWKERGIRVVVWTVNDPHEKEYYSQVLNIAYITDTLK